MAFEYELKKMGIKSERRIVSIGDDFKASDYDFVFFGGGQDYEQEIVRRDLINKKEEIKKFIDDGGLFLAICGGYQLLGKYYYTANGDKISGLNIFSHYTINQESKNRFIGQIKIDVNEFDEIGASLAEEIIKRAGITLEDWLKMQERNEQDDL